MSDLIRILDIARRALNAHQNSMNTATHNISNLNTDGYSRQRAILTPSRQIETSLGRLGSGVEVQRIERIRSTFIDLQLINERPVLSQFEFKSDALQFIEQVFNEPSDVGLHRLIEDFFDGFQDLSNEPESVTARAVIRDRAVSLSNGFKRIRRQIFEYGQHLNMELRGHLDDVNRFSKEIAKLNQQIVNAEVGGQEASTLRDRRDFVVEQLSKLANIRTNENQFGAVNVALGRHFLVVETQAQAIDLEVLTADAAGPKVVFEQTGEEIELSGGTLKGMLDVRDKNIADYLSQLDELAVALADEVNKTHRTGFNLDGLTGYDFFKSGITGAADFELSSDILNNASLIATADLAGEPGNNNVALKLANLKNSMVMNGGEAKFSEFYDLLLVSVGSQTQEAILMKDSLAVTVQKLEFSRDSISGVSLDEETTRLIEAQQAYTAATRVITTVDEMTQSVLNMI
ncbi:flagellar hook-associated protein FlgK [bacterium]|nr:flagellar hook-associated protein FlgK [bacterium]